MQSIELSAVDTPSRHRRDGLGALDWLAGTPFAAARRIWSASHVDWRDHYVCFRREFDVDSPPSTANLVIAADSDFVVFLNEREVGRGQFSDFSHTKTWTEFSISDQLRAGKNVLAVLVYYRGEDFLDHQSGAPGLLLSMTVGRERIETDESWKAKAHSAFRQGRRERMTSQCGFTFEFDARMLEPWTGLDYSDRSWDRAADAESFGSPSSWLVLAPRPLPPLLLGELHSSNVVIQGSYIQGERRATAAESMASCFLRADVFPWNTFSNHEIEFPVTGERLNAGRFLMGKRSEPLSVLSPASDTDGRFFIVDMGVEVVGILEFTVEAKPGTILEIAHGEHLDDGRVRASVGGRNFADRYICGEGKRHFQMPFRRLGARYIQVHCSDAVQFYSFGIRAVRTAGTWEGMFSTHDALARRIHETALRTLDLCRHEHYEDCPWREQALYGFDSRLQALYGYYAIGDYEFPRVSFSLLGKSSVDGGFLALTAPGVWPTTIPSFSFAWIVAVAEHWLYSGSGSLFHDLQNEVKAVVARGTSSFDIGNGIYHPPSDPSLWHFYEWTAGLAGCGDGTEDVAGIHQAGYNLYLHEALRSYAWMLDESGNHDESKRLTQQVRELGVAIHRNFWDSTGACYCSTIKAGVKSGRSELIQVLALCEGIVPMEFRSPLIRDIMDRKFVPCMLSAAYYRTLAMFGGGRESRAWVDESLCETWSNMAFAGASTMWETEKGAMDFDYAGSLCHGWSALPVYYHQAMVLGVTPLTPGFQNFAVSVYPSRFYSAKGRIPTPWGAILVEWKKTDAGLEIFMDGPQVCQPSLRDYPEAPIANAFYNGIRIDDLRLPGVGHER